MKNTMDRQKRMLENILILIGATLISCSILAVMLGEGNKGLIDLF
jgi:hypothetical protein